VTQILRDSGFRRASRSCLFAVLAVLLAELPSAGVRAEPAAGTARRRVLLLADKMGDSFVGRIMAEIASLGIDVITHAALGSLEADARAEHASAAIRLLPSRKGVEVWMADETSGRSLLRQVIVDETPGGPDQNLIALQTAELLRTSFFPKGETRQSASSPPPIPPPPPVVTPPPGETGVQAGMGFLYSAGGPSSALQAWLSLQHIWGRHFGIAFDLSAPMNRGTLSGPEGSSDVGAIFVGGELLVRLPTEKDRFFLTTGLGGALTTLVAKARPSEVGRAQLTGSSVSAYTGSVYLRALGGWKPVGWLGFGVMGVVGTTMGRVQLQFAGNDAGTWGVPFVGGLLFAEVDWH